MPSRRRTPYGGTVTRSPIVLAALATAAVPGLDPTTTWGPDGDPGHRYDLGFCRDSRDKTWVVRSPRTAADGAHLDASATLLRLIGRRLPFKVPAPAGFATIPQGRAMVYPALPGQPLEVSGLPRGLGLAHTIGRALAAIHNLDRAIFDEAGAPSDDAEECRRRRLAELDRAAATGHVPSGLLARWERALEDVSIWRFAATPVHGSLAGHRILLSFSDDTDAATGAVTGITGWESAHIGDPADDFAAFAACDPEVLDELKDGYRSALVERADPHLLLRAQLAAELTLLRRLLASTGSGERELTAWTAAALRRLDQRLAATSDDPLSRHVYRDGDIEPWEQAADLDDDAPVASTEHDSVGDAPTTSIDDDLEPGDADGWDEVPGEAGAAGERPEGTDPGHLDR